MIQDILETLQNNHQIVSMLWWTKSGIGPKLFGVVVYFGFRFSLGLGLVLVLRVGLGLVFCVYLGLGVWGRFWLGPSTQLDLLWLRDQSFYPPSGEGKVCQWLRLWLIPLEICQETY